MTPTPEQLAAAEALDPKTFDGHTPGPWLADGAHRVQSVGAGIDVCHMDRVPPHLDDEISQRATTRLIEKAPLILALIHQRDHDEADLRQPDARREVPSTAAGGAELYRHRELAHSLGGELYGWNGPFDCTVRIDGVLYDIPPPVYRAIADARLEAKRLRTEITQRTSAWRRWDNQANGFPLDSDRAFDIYNFLNGTGPCPGFIAEAVAKKAIDTLKREADSEPPRSKP